MARRSFSPLLTAWAGAHVADQLAFAALPLTAVLALGAGPDRVGQLLAAQGMAWLLVTLPAGALVDRLSHRTLLIVAALNMLVALCVATVAAIAGSVPLLGLSTFAATSGTVVFVLTTTPLVASLTAPADLPRANARLELARAIGTLGAPPVVGVLAGHFSPTAGYALGIAAAAVAVIAALLLPADRRTLVGSAQSGKSPGAFVRDIVEGARFVLRHPLLRAIGLCAIFWNFAFFALLTVFVPFALGVIRLETASIGLVQSAYGAGLILGAAAAPAASRTFRPNALLLFGPGSSVAAPLLLLAAERFEPSSGLVLAALGYFSIGFGPMLWLVCQTGLRQIVTPSALLGRVGATVQVAVYGVRPLGALAGGWTASIHGYEAALGLAAVAFAASAIVVVLSPLARLTAMPTGAMPHPAR